MNNKLKTYYPVILGAVFMMMPLFVSLFLRNVTSLSSIIVTTEVELLHAIESADNDEIIILIEDTIDLTETVIIDSIDVTIGGSGTLTATDRNRHFIVGEATSSWSELAINSGRLSLTDTVVLTQPEGYEGYSGGVWVNGGTFIMRGGAIVGNNWQIPQGYAGDSRYRAGGGVHLRDLGLFIMHDGVIENNRAVYGGGVFIDRPEGLFIMHGGLISNNEAYLGGAFYHAGLYLLTTNTGRSFSMSPAPSMTVFEMHGGEISGNQAQFAGGALYFDGSSNAHLNGGVMSENSAASHGGIYGNLIRIARGMEITENSPVNEFEVSQLQLFLSWLASPNWIVFSVAGGMLLFAVSCEVKKKRR